jgi:hypothetical protein
MEQHLLSSWVVLLLWFVLMQAQKHRHHLLCGAVLHCFRRLRFMVVAQSRLAVFVTL